MYTGHAAILCSCAYYITYQIVLFGKESPIVKELFQSDGLVTSYQNVLVAKFLWKPDKANFL